MSRNTLPRGLFLTIALVAVAQCVYGFPLLPQRMASHFGPSGMPNGWMTKFQFVVVYAITLIPALMVEFWVARTIAKMDGARINLPNKEFWLAPERREATFAYFEGFFAWYGCVFLLLIVFVMGLAMRANLTSPPRLPTGPLLSALVAFTAYNIAAIVVMLRRFSTPK